MTDIQIQLRHLETQLAEQEMILPLVPAGEFNDVQEKIDSITDRIEVLKAADFLCLGA